MTLTAQELYAKYAHEYSVWLTKPGITDDLLLSRIIRDYEIARSAATYTDFTKIMAETKEPQFIAILGFTERLPDANGILGIKYHTMLFNLLGTELNCWNPLEAGGHEEGPIEPGNWEDWKLRGMVLYS